MGVIAALAIAALAATTAAAPEAAKKQPYVIVRQAQPPLGSSQRQCGLTFLLRHAAADAKPDCQKASHSVLR